MKKKLLTAILAATTAITCAISMSGCEALFGKPNDGNEGTDGTQQEGSVNSSQNNGAQAPDSTQQGSGNVTSAPTPHTHTYESGWTFNKYSHWHASDCGHADEISGKADHNLDENGCKDCGFKYTQGLEYKYNSYVNGYSVTDIGTATDSVVIVPPTHNGLPVYSLEYVAFAGYEQITRAILPDGIETMGESVFEDCVNLASVELPSTLTQLYRGVFAGCTSLKSIDLPESLTHICDNVFNGSGITELYLPKNVYGVLYNSFLNSNIEKITIDPANTYLKCENNCIIDLWGKKGDIIVALNTNVIPASAQSIGWYSFYNSKDIKTIDIPANVKSIDNYAFYNCTSLEEVKLHVGLTEISGRVFNSALKDIYFDGTVAQWNAINKSTVVDGNGDWSWDYGMSGYTVHCTDGNITK